MIRYLTKHPEAFDPETVRVLSDALDDAWVQIEAKVRNLDADAVREILAAYIVATAKLGERDHQRLVEGAVARLQL